MLSFQSRRTSAGRLIHTSPLLKGFARFSLPFLFTFSLLEHPILQAKLIHTSSLFLPPFLPSSTPVSTAVTHHEELTLEILRLSNHYAHQQLLNISKIKTTRPAYFLDVASQFPQVARIMINTFELLESKADKAISDGLCGAHHQFLASLGAVYYGAVKGNSYWIGKEWPKVPRSGA
ncbi:hypothetical protein POTOM_054372 [Populus tomentosa]|uniref:Uncharacterized protein n=1 Tax=Populus tomentosa TaxID=118781 RepID=A0A8X7Y7F1_POPTO|nr:hypothetical protein POTOM_054372 [Populus tomentosa]